MPLMQCGQVEVGVEMGIQLPPKVERLQQQLAKRQSNPLVCGDNGEDSKEMPVTNILIQPFQLQKRTEGKLNLGSRSQMTIREGA